MNMESRHIGRIVTGCLIGGVVVALALVLGPVAGAQEHVITGTVLLTFAASWASLATLLMRVPYAHVALVTDETAAQTSIHAIRDVVHAVRSNVPLDKS